MANYHGRVFVTPTLDIDQKIQRLVDALNAFRGITTVGSCGGHPGPLKKGQWADGNWYVTFTVRRDSHGWRALEFLAWLVNHEYVHLEAHVRLYPDSLPPYLNRPGSMLRFAIEGREGASSEALATFMNEMRETVYIPPHMFDYKRS